jgi:threonine synthase
LKASGEASCLRPRTPPRRRRSRTRAELAHQLRFARLSGLYAEVSSSITIAAARRLVLDGTIEPSASVACLLTATGLKDPATTLRRLSVSGAPT